MPVKEEVVYDPVVTTGVQFRSRRTENCLRLEQVADGQVSVTILLFSRVSDYSSNQTLRSTICIMYKKQHRNAETDLQ